MHELTGAIIGAGYFAQFHAEAWTRSRVARIAAVADPIPGRARAFADKYVFPRAYESVEGMFERERLDFVDIATRPESHLALVQAAATRGLHVICQKPMAPTMTECVAMCEACEISGVRLLLHENWRWQPWYREAKRVLEANRLGRPFQFSFFWRTGDGRGPEPYAHQPYFRTMPRLLVYETLVHILDTYRFLAGEIQSLGCELARVNPVIIGEDIALIQLRFQSGALGLIDGNRISGPIPAPVAMGRLVVEGESARLTMSPDGRLWLADDAGEKEHAYHLPSEGYKGDSVRATQEHLAGAVRDRQPSESDGRDYLRTVALVEACYRSHETRTMVNVA